MRYVCSLLLAAGFLAGCGGTRELEGSLDSKQSIEMMVVLSRSGIHADREKVASGQGEHYRVTVPSREYSRALELLHEYDLPQKRAEDIESFTRAPGFTPNSVEISDLRLDYALSLELERLLAALPGVIEVRAMVRSHLRRHQGQGTAEESAGTSIVVRYASASTAMPFTEEEIKEIVLQAVPGMTADSIRVKATRVFLPVGDAQFGKTEGANGNGAVVPLTQLRPFFVFRIPEEDLGKASRQLLFYTLAFCFSGGVLGAIWSSMVLKRRYGTQKKRPGSAGGDGRRSFFIEASLGNADTKNSERLLPGKGPQRGRVEQ